MSICSSKLYRHQSWPSLHGPLIWFDTWGHISKCLRGLLFVKFIVYPYTPEKEKSRDNFPFSSVSLMKSFQTYGISGMSLWSSSCQFIVLCWFCHRYHHSSRLSFTLPSHSNLIFSLSWHPVISSFELSFSFCPSLISHYHLADLGLCLLQGCSVDFLTQISTISRLFCIFISAQCS